MSESEENGEGPDVEEPVDLVAALASMRDEIDSFLKDLSAKGGLQDSREESIRLFGLGKKLCKAGCGLVYAAEKAACGTGPSYNEVRCRKEARRHFETCKKGC